MITHKNGNIFTTELNAIGHGVNTHGVMGSGIAVEVRERYPDVYEIYRKICKDKYQGMSGGELLVVKSKSDGRYILNLASQEKPGANATYEFLRESTKKAFEFCRSQSIPAFALPRIGSNIGGLEWDKVLDILEEEAGFYSDIDLEIWTFNPETDSREKLEAQSTDASTTES